MPIENKASLRIMSHNVWCGEVHNRDLHLSNIYHRYLPDVLGLQEMTPNLYESRLLSLIADEYELLRHPEAPGIEDNTPLLIRRGKFNVLEHGWHLYRGLNNHQSKSLAWAVLERKEDGVRFGAVSTHFWWRKGPESDLAREDDVYQMMAFVNYMRVKYNIPVVAMGDWNCLMGSLAYRAALAAGGLDVRLLAQDSSDLRASHHPYAVYNPDTDEYENGPMAVGTCTRSIDHIFVYGETGFDVREFRVVDEQEALDTSDHCPIYMDCNVRVIPEPSAAPLMVFADPDKDPDKKKKKAK